MFRFFSRLSMCFRPVGGILPAALSRRSPLGDSQSARRQDEITLDSNDRFGFKRVQEVKNKYEYPQTAQTLCACQQTYAAINIIMLMATARTVLAKRLVSNELRNVSFCLAKCAVLRAKTGHIAVQKRPFQGATWHLRKNKSTATASSCISASMGKKLMPIYSI